MLKLTCLLVLLAPSAALGSRLTNLPIETQFAIAVKNGNAEIVAEILKNNNIDINEVYVGKTHIARAAINSLLYTNTFVDMLFDNPYVETVKVLLEHGADPCKMNAYLDVNHNWYPATARTQYLAYTNFPRSDVLNMLECPELTLN